MSLKVSIIIVNYNNYTDTIDSLNSLLKLNNIEFANIVVVDNCSTNDSFNIITNNFDNPIIHIIKADENKGYCAGNNIGIEYAKSYINPDYYWILNPDTIVDVDAMVSLIEFAEAHSDAGFVGSKLVYYPDSDKIQAFGGGNVAINKLGIIKCSRIFYLQDTEKKLPEYIALDVIIGASMFIRKEAVANIGPMNESYFMYWDETEYCVRAKRAGWKIYAVSKSVVYHKEGWRKKDQNIWSEYYAVRNFLFFTKKYYKKYLLVNFIYTCLISCKIAIASIVKKRKLTLFRLRIKAITDFILNKQGRIDINKYLAG